MTEQDKTSLINPNLASLEELQSLSGVGPGLADRIQQGRPYQAPEDLLKVAGIGQESLERWFDQLTFEGETDEDHPAATPAAEPTKVEPASATPETAAKRVKAASPLASSRLLWLALAVVLSVFLSVSLTLGVLLSINGTLNIGRHSSVKTLDSEMADLEAELTDLRNQVEAIDRRLGALEGLSSRMGQVEDQVGELEGQMQEALTSVQRVRQRFDAVEQVTQSLNRRVDRFDQFLDGLRELLVEQNGAPSPEPQEQEAIPSQ